MTPLRILGIVLILAGVLALAYGGFTYTEDRHEAELGPLSFEYEEKEHVPIPQWAGWTAVAVGVVLLIIPKRKR